MQEPIAITPDGEIICGHRRYRAAIALGFETVAVRILPALSEDEKEISLVSHNKHRIKTGLQLAREAEVLMRHLKSAREALKEKAKLDMVGMENFPSPQLKTTRDIVGQILGCSGKTVDSAIKASKALDQFSAIGDEKNAQAIKASLEKSVNCGLKAAKAAEVSSFASATPQETDPPELGGIQSIEAAPEAGSSPELESAKAVVDFLEKLATSGATPEPQAEWRIVLEQLSGVSIRLGLISSKKEVTE